MKSRMERADVGEGVMGDALLLGAQCSAEREGARFLQGVRVEAESRVCVIRHVCQCRCRAGEGADKARKELFGDDLADQRRRAQ